tara:strand:- start:4 stop:768 length:765 start_codon:yes stop_codon:yes gene_type:complete
MDGQNYVVFHNDSDDSYMNSTANFRGAEIEANVINCYFKAAATGTGQGAAAYDKIVLAVGTAGNEETAVEGLAAALAGAKNPVTIIADDKNGVYCHDTITGVTSITLGISGRFAAVESVTTNDTLTASDSGKLFLFTDAAAVLTLPDSGAGDIIGWTATFHSTTQATGQEVKNADTTNEKMIGSIIAPDSDGDGAPLAWNAKAADSFSSIEFTSVADGEPGSYFTLTNVAADVWHIEGVASQSGGSEATPFATS